MTSRVVGLYAILIILFAGICAAAVSDGEIEVVSRPMVQGAQGSIIVQVGGVHQTRSINETVSEVNFAPVVNDITGYKADKPNYGVIRFNAQVSDRNVWDAVEKVEFQVYIPIGSKLVQWVKGVRAQEWHTICIVEASSVGGWPCDWNSAADIPGKNTGVRVRARAYDGQEWGNWYMEGPFIVNNALVEEVTHNQPPSVTDIYNYNEAGPNSGVITFKARAQDPNRGDNVEIVEYQVSYNSTSHIPGIWKAACTVNAEIVKYAGEGIAQPLFPVRESDFSFPCNWDSQDYISGKDTTVRVRARAYDGQEWGNWYMEGPFIVNNALVEEVTHNQPPSVTDIYNYNEAGPNSGVITFKARAQDPNRGDNVEIVEYQVSYNSTSHIPGIWKAACTVNAEIVKYAGTEIAQPLFPVRESHFSFPCKWDSQDYISGKDPTVRVRARAYDGQEWGNWYIEGPFTVDNGENETENHPPIVTLTNPVCGQTYDHNDVIPVVWTMSDPDGNQLYVKLTYSAPADFQGITIAQGYMQSPFLWNVSLLLLGNYNVKVGVFDGEYWAYSSTSCPIIIAEEANETEDCAVTASAEPMTGDVPLDVRFSAEATGVEPFTFDWTINGVHVSSLQGFSYTFSDAGTFTAAVTAHSHNGATCSDTVTVVAASGEDVPATAKIIAEPTSGSAPLFVHFRGVGTGNGQLTYAWDFGDGRTGRGRLISHTYQKDGRYSARLTVTDADGDKAVAYATIVVGSTSDFMANSRVSISRFVIFDENTQAGGELRGYIELQNLGESDIEEAKIILISDDLGVREAIGPFDIEGGETVTKNFVMDVPTGAEAGTYELMMSVSFEGDNKVEYRPFTIAEEGFSGAVPSGNVFWI